jgi:molybdenum cofactor synthesis domain-containing protein
MSGKIIKEIKKVTRARRIKKAATKRRANEAAEREAIRPRNAANAAVLIIGDEILTGRTEEKNANYIAKKLNELGIDLHEIRVVPDIEEMIVDSLNSLRKNYHYVFTSGGIGPTHDDITAACVAKAFGVQIIRDGEALRRLREYYKADELNEARRRMADVPRGATLIDNPVSIAPGFRMENVFVMAGVPRILQAMFDNVIEALEGGEPMKSKTITCSLREGEVSEELGKIQRRFGDMIKIGSYPYFREGQYGVSFVIRSHDEIALQRAVADVKHMIEYLSDKRPPITL